MIHKPQYLDVLSSEIEKSLYKICLLYIYKDTFIYIIQILYRFFSIISLEKTSKYCAYTEQDAVHVAETISTIFLLVSRVIIMEFNAIFINFSVISW